MLQSGHDVAGPLAMTGMLAFFSSPAAPVYFPGAAFLLATALTFVAAAVVLRYTSERH